MLIVDRIEGKIVICEQDGIMLELTLEQISGAVHEGDTLVLMEGGHYTADRAATQQRREKMAGRFASLRKKKN